MPITIKITPPTRKDKRGRTKKILPRLPYADTALEFKYNEITKRAFSRKFTLNLLEKKDEHVEIVVIDGRRKRHKLQYFNKNRSISCCSCEEFIKDECRFCVHLAAVENVLSYPSYYRKQDKNYNVWCATLRSYLIKTPNSPKKYTQHYTFWDPYKATFYTFGHKKPTKETVSTKTHKKLVNKKQQNMVQWLPKELSDKGLLKGVELYDYQKNIFSSMLSAQRAICSMIMGAGKAQWVYSKILTPSGWAFMKDIKRGDCIIGSSGKPVKVIGVFPQGKKDMFRVTFSDGSSTLCCDEHLWAITKNTLNSKNKYMVRPLKAFMEDVSNESTGNFYSIPMVRPVQFHCKDYDTNIQNLSALLKRYENHKTCSLPRKYKYGSLSTRIRTIQVLMDRYGVVDHKGGYIKVVVASKCLAQDIQELSWSLGGTATIKTDIKGLTYKIDVVLPKSLIPFVSSKKLRQYISAQTSEPQRRFVSVEYVGKLPAQCIAIDSEDQLYVTDDYIVTHNTLTTIACYSFINKHKPNGNASILIIAPKSLRYQWGEEIERTCNLKAFQIEKHTQIEKAMQEDINVVTYQLLSRHVDKFAKRKYDVIVIDEIQYIRNNKTKTWKAISKLKSDFFFGLSGTVIENRLDDLYSIMEIVSPGILGPKWKFDDRFQEIQIKSRNKWIYKGCKNLDSLRELLKNNVFSYDKLSLPAIHHHNIFITIGKRESSLHEQFYSKAQELIAKSLNGTTTQQERVLVQALLLKCRQVANAKELITKKREPASPKISQFLELVEKICVQKNEKLVVFSDWVEMLEICDRFVKQKFKLQSAFFTGKQNSKQRSDALKRFQNDPKCMIFFASDAGAVGLDGLQLASSNIIHCELPWNPAKLDQRTGRVHRLLQKNEVNVYYLIAKDTIEEKIFLLIRDKKQIRTKTLAEFQI